jgi:carbamoyltransferase
MIICGLKLTHDGSISIIDAGVLKFCVELEKVNNNHRYKSIDSLDEIEGIVNGFGYPLSSIDKFVVDGWIGTESSKIKKNNLGTEVTLECAPYHESNDETILKRHEFDGLPIGSKCFPYESYNHVAGHILSAYWTSPFSKANEDSYVLVWDGGTHPRLYYYNAALKRVYSLGSLFYMGVNIYSIFAQHFGIFKLDTKDIKNELTIAGKVMAYVPFGRLDEAILNDLELVYQKTLPQASNPKSFFQYPYLFVKEFIETAAGKKYQDKDILCTFHYFLEDKLISNLRSKTKDLHCKNLCFVGGAALNIKWNSSIRKAKLFENIWIPPFPNDSGSSIGAAIGGWLDTKTSLTLNWNVYSGPTMIHNEAPEGWRMEACDIPSLARILHEGNPVVVLNGSAELGPRALGNRSILASPLAYSMKDKLNHVKKREDYRPIAPVCLEEMAPQIFEPGCPDPYMLFEHSIREEWRQKIPAVSHVDHSARLQTVTAESNYFLYRLLKEFEKRSGVPVLCNTSANLNGSGFFPDVYSAANWGKLDYIYSDGFLYQKMGEARQADCTHVQETIKTGI